VGWNKYIWPAQGFIEPRDCEKQKEKTTTTNSEDSIQGVSRVYRRTYVPLAAAPIKTSVVVKSRSERGKRSVAVQCGVFVGIIYCTLTSVGEQSLVVVAGSSNNNITRRALQSSGHHSQCSFSVGAPPDKYYQRCLQQRQQQQQCPAPTLYVMAASCLLSFPVWLVNSIVTTHSNVRCISLVCER
jgi:hypothetical protein